MRLSKCVLHVFMGLNLFTVYNFIHNTEIQQENTASLEKKNAPKSAAL